MPAAEQVQVQVVHCLPAIVSRVHDDAVTLVQLLSARNLSRSCHQMTHQSRVFGQRLSRGADVLLGNHQKVRRRLRIDVREADAAFVFIHAVRRYGAGDDLAKQTIGRRMGRA